ncbi:amino acid permease [Nocardia sp. NBC_00565]|uniref:amino acid permease n=1 Tax=Nocardia sp. NBC_00565 TaxID=2975993 RepID=UPI002E818AA3|nr:amino acid permease [Nocardia sp. NBC_00565]WUC03318.1 amino acid permease [Nocardia sp. NBC_00565]
MQQHDELSATAPQVDISDVGYQKRLRKRHMQMIAIGGSIGTGLFLGASGRMALAGPSLAIVYIVCGIFTFMVVRALGELVMHRPSSGAFVSYAREFLGERGAYSVGWLYFLNWSTTLVADITAVALYAHFWSPFVPIPQWALALIALAVVVALNVVSVRLFGELEFWFALVKVGTIVVFMILAVFFIVTGTPLAGHTPGISTITDNGGLFPRGLAPMLTIALGVVFAFGGTETIGVAAGESDNPRAVVPKAVNSIMWRIILFYAGSVVLFTLLLPWTAYSSSESPFVTVMSSIGIPHAGDVMNVVVLTAAMSSLNAGLYATGRTLRSMAVAGAAPRFAARLNRQGVPYGGVLITSVVGIAGVVLNLLVPKKAFEIVLNLAGLGIVGTWASIMICHWIFVRRCERGTYVRPTFRLPFAPVLNVLTLGFLAGVVALMFFDDEIGRITLVAFLAVVAAMVAGWYRVRGRLDADVLAPMQRPETATGGALDA